MEKIEAGNEIFIYSVGSLWDQAVGKIKDGIPLEFDISAVSSVDGAGFQFLIFLHKKAIREPDVVQLVGINEYIKSCCEKYGYSILDKE